MAGGPLTEAEKRAVIEERGLEWRFEKQDVVEGMEWPFEIVDRSGRRTPLHEHNPRDCPHDEVCVVKDEYPIWGATQPTFVCVDCGSKSIYPRDFKRA